MRVPIKTNRETSSDPNNPAMVARIGENNGSYLLIIQCGVIMKSRSTMVPGDQSADPMIQIIVMKSMRYVIIVLIITIFLLLQATYTINSDFNIVLVYSYIFY